MMLYLQHGNAKIDHFKESEFYDFEKMDKYLILKLDLLRSKLNMPIMITSSNQPRENKESQHNQNRAVDFFILGDQNKIKNDLFRIILLFAYLGFTGIGVYSGWKLVGKKMVGFHLDTRKLGSLDTIKTWYFENEKYLALTIDNLKRLRL